MESQAIEIISFWALAITFVVIATAIAHRAFRFALGWSILIGFSAAVVALMMLAYLIFGSPLAVWFFAACSFSYCDL